MQLPDTIKKPTAYTMWKFLLTPIVYWMVSPFAVSFKFLQLIIQRG